MSLRSVASHVLHALGKNGPLQTCQVLSLRHWIEYQSNTRYNSIENEFGTI